MNTLKRLVVEEEGQGLIEYTLITLLVVFVFWLGVRNTGIGAALTTAWTNVIGCLNAPMTCLAP